MPLAQIPKRRTLAVCLALGVLAACGGERASVEFQNLRVEEVAARRAVVRFDTSLPTSCEVRYGVEVDALNQSATDPNMAPGQLSYTHDVPLEDLEPATTYYFAARAVDRAGKPYLSQTLDFASLADETTNLGQNLALLSGGAQVTQVSSNWAEGDNDSSFGANNAFDGQMASEWSSNGDGDGAWVELKLDSEHLLTTFAFRSRQMSDGSSIVKRVELWLDGASVGAFDTPDPSERYEFTFEPTRASLARVSVLASTGGNTGAREIELYE